MAQGHLSNCCTSSSCFERSCFLQSVRGSSNPRENGRSSFRLKLHAYPSIICRQFVVVRASLPPHHHHPSSSSSSLTSAATSSFSSNKTLQCPPPHGLLLRYTSLSRRTGGGFVPCNAARSSALSESEEMMPTTSRRVTDNRLPQLVDVVPPVVEFKLSDFELCSHVSVGLAGRGDEVVYEGVVRNPESPLRGMRVVLRQLTGPRAQRWGHRALQVIARLVRREDLYHSYATRVHGYILPSGTASDESNTLTLVHGYYGSYSLHQWLLCHDWLPNLEARLALDEEAARRVGDDRTGGPEVSRQLRLLRVIMRDLLIGLNYVHSRGLAHTELRLQNVHISAADRHVKVGILGNAADFPGNDFGKTMVFASSDSKSAITRRLMIAFDIRCVGYMMAKMVLRELMDPAIFSLVKNFLTQGHDPAGLREFFSSLVKSASGNTGVQILDRDGGAGWNLLACMLTNKSAERISCTDALRHPFLCGPKWRVESSLEMTRWSLGSFAVRIVEDFMYGADQRNRLSQLIDLLERVNPNSSYKEWMKLLPGRWRLLYHTGKLIGLTRRQANPAVLVDNLIQDFQLSAHGNSSLTMRTSVGFTVMAEDSNWSAEKTGPKGKFNVCAHTVALTEDTRLYEKDGEGSDKAALYPKQRSINHTQNHPISHPTSPEIGRRADGSLRFRKQVIPDETPSSMPVIRLDVHEDLEMSMELDMKGISALPKKVLQEVQLQIPREMFDLTNLVCATYIDSRLLILRGVSGAALLFIRSPVS